MATILLAVAFMGLSVAGLAVGVLFGRKPLKGSCGGLACRSLSCGACPKRRADG